MSTGVVKSVPEHRFVLAVAYSANRLPARGADKRTDIASPEVLEKAAWKFAMNGFKVGVNHRDGTEGAARVVENYVHRGRAVKFRSADGTVQKIRRGDWVVGMVLSPEAWDKFKRGELTGLSPQGTAGRKKVSAETLKRMRDE